MKHKIPYEMKQKLDPLSKIYFEVNSFFSESKLNLLPAFILINQTIIRFESNATSTFEQNERNSPRISHKRMKFKNIFTYKIWKICSLSLNVDAV